MKHVAEVLFPFVVSFYLLDCISYIRANHLLFVSQFGRRFRLESVGIHLVGLLPTAEAVVSFHTPIHPASNGLYIEFPDSSGTRPAHGYEDLDFVAYSDINSIEAEGKSVKLNNSLVFRMPSQASARRTVNTIQKLKGLEYSKRLEAIRESLDQATDLSRVRGLRISNSSVLLSTKIVGAVLFIETFVLLPLALYLDLYPRMSFIILMTGIVLTYFLSLVTTFDARREIYDTGISHTIYAMLPMVLSPVTAIHTPKDLTRDAYIRFDYLTIAAEFLPSHEFKTLIREELLRLNYATDQNIDHNLKEFLRIREVSLLNLLAETGVSAEELVAAPEHNDPAAASYCPFCRTEYGYGVDKCADCGVNLERFA